jgi:hypothetical protein
MRVRSDSTLTVQPGIYALVLECPRNGPVRIGSLGTLQLQPGFYAYVGSAFGMGPEFIGVANESAVRAMAGTSLLRPEPGFSLMEP